MDAFDEERAAHIAGIDQEIHEAAVEAAKLYLAAGASHAQLPELIRPFVTKMIELRMQAVAQLDANLLRMRAIQMRIAQLERLAAEVVY